MNNFVLLMPLFLLGTGLVTIFTNRSISKFLLLIVSIFLPIIFILNFSISGNISYNWLGNSLINLSLSLSITKLLFFAMVWFSLFVYSIANLCTKNREESWVLFAAGGLGLSIFAGDLITFFIGWEIMSWASYLPILSRSKNVKVARKYLVFGLTGAMFLLTGILLIGVSSGFNIQDILFTKEVYIALPFLLIGFLLKSGIMPLHRWIPSVYNESSDLFTGFLSGALSKAGVYGLVLLYIIYPHKSLNFLPIIGWLGAITALFATFRAIKEPVIKRLLAWSSIAQLGYIFAAIGLGTAEGISSGIYHAVIHTIIKVLLFTTVAGIIHRTGKTRFDQLGGLINKMPFSFIAVLIGIISLAGMPPLGGFASKWAIYSALLSSGKILELIIIIAASTAAFIYNYKLIYGIFLGHPTECDPNDIKETPLGYRLAVILPLILLIITGMYPSLIYKIINPILGEIGFGSINQDNPQVLSSLLGSYNGFVVMLTFGITFVVILFLFSLVKGKSRDVNRLDIAYAGETPEDSYPLHYGHGMGQEIDRIPFIGFWLSKTTKGFYRYIHSLMDQLSSLIRLFYTGNIATLFYVLFIGSAVLWIFVSGGKM
ncbi:sodium:proton antiporter [Thiospirochaeta perfilievii]|uniref:Sodium:proton antiporter n=1 Tax=Thiospirochaeta perfilievii TaxID=252967 RepID=A0A5C1Q753_9SPIO|nr:proton-conducting transporter membrane subunit [Thiospirochaeta perfilievii]QEN03903.1 sodium:proton antiporter [Thiospirochaeta perfilievii]